MAEPWQSGTLYQPGDLVRPTNSGVVTQPPLDNPNFDDGDTGWTESGFGSWTIDTDAPVFNGTFSGKAGFTSNPNGQQLRVINDEVLPAVPGQIVTARCFVFGPTASGDPSRVQFQIQWYSAAMAALAPSKLPVDPTEIFGEPRVDNNGLVQYACREIWLGLEVTGIAPAGAAFFTIEWIFSWGDMPFAVDGVSLEYAEAAEANTLLFRAVQAAAGFSGSTEPDWPTSIGLTVVDNEVTWEAVAGNSVTWQASRILVSACPASSEDVEPVWPLLAGGSVPDGSISWMLDSRRVTDTHVPVDSPIALLAASKVYVADGDIIPYSATVNPLDWSTAEDAGFIPFGLQVYGANPITAMGLYRGNVAAFNSQGCQIWQVDPDPAAITLLDAIPVPCTFPKSLAPVGDDLALLTNLGIRSLGVAGSEVNLAGGYFGKQVDPLVVAAIAEALEEGWTPRGLYWPAHGQYWLFFGAQAFVLTINGPAKEQRSWSRYTFPWVVDAWTIQGTDLVLRAGELVLVVDRDALCDDDQETVVTHATLGGTEGDQFVGVFFGGPGAFNPDPTEVGSVEILELYQMGSVGVGQVGDLILVATEQITTAVSVSISTQAGTQTFLFADASSQGATSGGYVYQWDDVSVWSEVDVGAVRTVSFNPTACEPFTSVIQWPFLDLNNFSSDKELVGFDLSIEGVCTMSIGFDQRNTEYEVDSTWTVPYEIDGDTMPGQMIPFSVSGPSFALRLEFASEQSWKWYAAALHIKDLAP